MVKQQKIVLLAAGCAGALLAAVLLVGTVAEVAAQDGRGRPGFARGGGPGGLGLFGPGGGGIDGANLTDAQKEQVKSIVDAHRDEMRGLLDRQAQARRALAAAAERGQVDDAAANDVGAASASLALAEARMRAEVFQLLTPEQRAAIQKREHDNFRCKSFMTELIMAHLFDKGLNGSDYPSALFEFFGFVVRTGLKEQIVFADYYKPGAVGPSKDPMQIFDPVNATNNVASKYTETDRITLVSAAEEAVDAIAYARRATTKGEAVDAWQTIFGSSFRG